MPVLSIITPTYNRAHTLKVNFASVAAQTFSDIEHVIVDNMSHDGTETLVAEYRRKSGYPVIYIREPDTGIYNAINKGLRAARGAWTHILNSDDAYSGPTILDDLFHKDLGAYDLVANAVLLVDDSESGNQIVWVPTFDERIGHYNFPHPGLIIKNSFYRSHGYYREDFRIVSDAIYGIEHYPKADYLIVNSPLVIMRRGGASEVPSLRNIYEKLVSIAWYHRFPRRVKLLACLKEIWHWQRRLRNRSW